MTGDARDEFKIDLTDGAPPTQAQLLELVMGLSEKVTTLRKQLAVAVEERDSWMRRANRLKPKRGPGRPRKATK